jgi:hypothetical protein
MSVLPSSRVSTPASCRFPFVLPQLADQARKALGPDVHLKRILLHVDPLDQELDDPRLLGREQLVPYRGELGEKDGDLALSDLLIAFPLCGGPGPGNQLRRSEQLLDAVEDRALYVGRRHARNRAAFVPGTSAQLGSPAASSAMDSAQRRVKAATWLRSS